MSKMEQQELAQTYKKDFVGKRYRHFKGANYIVKDIAIHSETEELMVIYQSEDNPILTWARPIWMFISAVDHEKYPKIEQKYRFEEIK